MFVRNKLGTVQSLGCQSHGHDPITPNGEQYDTHRIPIQLGELFVIFVFEV